MEIEDLKTRQEFNAYYRANHMDLFDFNEIDFYGKPDIEQNAYYLAFLESKGIIVYPGIKKKIENKFFAVVYFNETLKISTLGSNFPKASDAVAYGIKYAFKILIKKQ